MTQKNDIDLSKIIKVIKVGKNNILYTVLIGFLLSLIYLSMATSYYKSYISIAPMGDTVNSSTDGLQNIMSDFGINTGDFLNEKPSFYIPDIVNSRILKKAVINNQWKTMGYDSINLITYWGIDDSTKFSLGKIIKKITGKKSTSNLEARYMNVAINKLNKQIIVEKEESGLIVISVLMEEPELAADLANYIASYIKTYVSDITISHSSKHRKFIEERVKYAKKDLADSEDELKEFSENNPYAIDTPELQLDRGRLIRNMEVNQQVYITLRQQYEMARINELKEIPVINVLDYGEASSDKAKPQAILFIMLCIISTFFISSTFLIIKNEIKSSY